MTPDGLTAFVAEDHLLVREIHLPSRQPVGLFTAGRGGDRAIADLALDGDRLLVVTRSVPGRSGTLTVLDRSTGAMDVEPLDIDPARITVLGGRQALVLPAVEHAWVEGTKVLVSGDPRFHVVEAGRVSGTYRAAGVVLDAAPAPGGALVLREDDQGVVHADRFDPWTGLTRFATSLPAVTRIVSAGGGVAVLLGDPAGDIWSLELAGGLRRIVAGTADPEGLFGRIP